MYIYVVIAFVQMVIRKIQLHRKKGQEGKQSGTSLSRWFSEESNKNNQIPPGYDIFLFFNQRVNLNARERTKERM